MLHRKQTQYSGTCRKNQYKNIYWSFTLLINFHIFKKNCIWNHCHTEHIDSFWSCINSLKCYHPCSCIYFINHYHPYSYIYFLHCYQDTRLLQCLFASILITLVYNLIKTEILWQNTEIETHFNDYLSMTVNLIFCEVMSCQQLLILSVQNNVT